MTLFEVIRRIANEIGITPTLREVEKIATIAIDYFGDYPTYKQIEQIVLWVLL